MIRRPPSTSPTPLTTKSSSQNPSTNPTSLTTKSSSQNPIATPLPHPPTDFEQAWIVYEDDDVIVVDKPAGAVCQAVEAGGDDDLVSRLRRYLAKRDSIAEEHVYLGTHQRLDAETSGLLLYTRRPEANAFIAQQFSSRTVHKSYIAAVENYLGGEQTLRDHLVKEQGGDMRVTGDRDKRSKQAITHVTPKTTNNSRSLLELDCRTGRTHQLRVQLAHRGFPIAGDLHYGKTPAPRLLLHAHSLRLLLPSGHEHTWTSPTPFAFELWMQRGMPEVTDKSALFAALSTAIGRRFGLMRAAAQTGQTTAFRLVNGEADGLPGLAVDAYDDYLVANLFDEALDAEADILAALSELGYAGIYVKRHPRQKNTLVDARQRELCPAEPLVGKSAPQDLVVYEYGVPFGVRLGDGLRTGLFLDQRDNRRRIAELCAGKRLLNLFAYTGGFSTAALAHGAAFAQCVDASAAALERAKENVARIGGSDHHRTWADDVFSVLPRLAKRHERFDVVVLDPPSYATTKRRRFVAEKDYAELVALCLVLIAPGGYLLCCLNHHQVSRGKLRSLVRQGAELAGHLPVRLRDLSTGRDFPWLPEKEPLFKSLLCQRLPSDQDQ